MKNKRPEGLEGRGVVKGKRGGTQNYYLGNSRPGGGLVLVLTGIPISCCNWGKHTHGLHVICFQQCAFPGGIWLWNFA